MDEYDRLNKLMEINDMLPPEYRIKIEGIVDVESIFHELESTQIKFRNDYWSKDVD